jgi:hypothetical protein
MGEMRRRIGSGTSPPSTFAAFRIVPDVTLEYMTRGSHLKTSVSERHRKVARAGFFWKGNQSARPCLTPGTRSRAQTKEWQW